MSEVHGVTVHGAVLDGETRCAHYNTELDVIAIKFKCCEKWFPCRVCHDEAERHTAEVWLKEQFTERVVLCGRGGHQLSIDEYLNSNSMCPTCAGKFNPSCASHYSFYFEI